MVSSMTVLPILSDNTYPLVSYDKFYIFERENSNWKENYAFDDFFDPSHTQGIAATISHAMPNDNRYWWILSIAKGHKDQN